MPRDSAIISYNLVGKLDIIWVECEKWMIIQIETSMSLPGQRPRDPRDGSGLPVRRQGHPHKPTMMFE